MNGAGEFVGEEAVGKLVPPHSAHAVKAIRHRGEPEVRIGGWTTVHMAFVQYFQKRRLEIAPGFLFKHRLHGFGVRHGVHRRALYSKIGPGNR